MLITQAPFFCYLKKRKYFWFLDDYVAFMYDTMDWGIGMAFQEKVANDLDGEQKGLSELVTNPQRCWLIIFWRTKNVIQIDQQEWTIR